jgi:hypothetical protein
MLLHFYCAHLSWKTLYNWPKRGVVAGGVWQGVVNCGEVFYNFVMYSNIATMSLSFCRIKLDFKSRFLINFLQKIRKMRSLCAKSIFTVQGVKFAPRGNFGALRLGERSGPKTGLEPGMKMLGLANTYRIPSGTNFLSQRISRSSTFKEDSPIPVSTFVVVLCPIGLSKCSVIRCKYEGKDR